MQGVIWVEGQLLESTKSRRKGEVCIETFSLDISPNANGCLSHLENPQQSHHENLVGDLGTITDCKKVLSEIFSLSYFKGSDNPWCIFRCGGCGRYLQATHDYAYERAWGGVKKLVLRKYKVLDSGFKSIIGLPKSVEELKLGCWLGTPCQKIMGPF